MMTLVDYILVVAVSILSGGASGYVVHTLMRVFAGRTFREYVSPINRHETLKGDVISGLRHEFLRENEKGEFVPTGELVPQGQDPNEAVMERRKLEGISYSAQKVQAA